MKQQRDKAVALRYREHNDRAPKVIAKGEGLIARTIKEIAHENGIPIQRDDALVELLAQIEIDREIPPELYAAIAELLSWIYRANNALLKEHPLP
ncbi:MAG: EscU/YscU/HrcU family type III secretion system export apparatus switch protein [Chitinispirillaceae bacterium]|nr:EscU/YscU/HrcU family type III secretion system export apparatus switch protein [Chitinispirillaceae bacterium]